MSVEVISFGCRLNLAEGETLRALLADDDDLIVINSCAVTAESERQARQAIRRAAKRRPDARIVVTGCAAEVSAEAFRAMPEVSAVQSKRVAPALRLAGRPATQDKLPIGQAGASAQSWHPTPAEAPAFAGVTISLPAVSGASHARAFIEVQNGCDHDCTFCVTTLARGPSRSIPADAVIDAAKAAVDRGQQEVVLTGIDLTDARPSLGALVARILRDVPALPRLRLSSLDSVEIDPLLEELLTGEPRVMPHVHLSLQHGDDLILKRMKRRHSRAAAIDLVQRLKAKRPEITIGADLIAGFPTEDDAMFENSVSLLEECDIVLAHIFPYSPRPGTAAARMPQLPRSTVRERAKRLRQAAEVRRRRWLASLIGTTQRCLIELDGQTGRTPNFAPVALEAPLPPGNMRGHMIDLIITASDSDSVTLTGAGA